MPHMPDPISTDSNNDLENNTDNAHLDRCRHLPEISGKSLSADESDSNAMTDSGIILREKNLSGSDQEQDIIKGVPLGRNFFDLFTGSWLFGLLLG